MSAGGATGPGRGVPAEPTLVLALGNPDRGDDGAGSAAARRLRELLAEEIAAGAVEIRELPGEATEILAAWEGPWRNGRRVIVLDAVTTGAPAGTLHRFGPDDLPPDLRSSPSSHGLGLAEAVALGRTLGRLPAGLEILGVEAATLETGAGLAPAVARSAERLARDLAGRLRGHLR